MTAIKTSWTQLYKPKYSKFKLQINLDDKIPINLDKGIQKLKFNESDKQNSFKFQHYTLEPLKEPAGKSVICEVFSCNEVDMFEIVEIIQSRYICISNDFWTSIFWNCFLKSTWFHTLNKKKKKISNFIEFAWVTWVFLWTEKKVANFLQ